MKIDKNIQRFEGELKIIDRPGMDKLLAYIRKSDFYSAPASTRYHLSCEGGLLQHSLNVLDALRWMLPWERDDKRYFRVAGQKLCAVPDESVTIMALLHDLCKTHYYKTSTRNVKNEQTGKWEKAPFYTVDDKMPLGHGAKSAMLAMQFIKLSNTEMYAIWHHMGFTDQGADFGTVGKAMELHPAVLALHTADMMASRLMEGENGNKEAFVDMPAGRERYFYHPESNGYWILHEGEKFPDGIDGESSVEITEMEYKSGIAKQGGAAAENSLDREPEFEEAPPLEGAPHET